MSDGLGSFIAAAIVPSPLPVRAVAEIALRIGPAACPLRIDSSFGSCGFFSVVGLRKLMFAAFHVRV